MQRIITVLFLFIFTNIYPQQATNFKNYTNMKNVSDIEATADGFWAATSGGGFFYNSSDNSFITVNKVNGLNSVSLSSITLDEDSKIWFGSSDGTINIYYPSTKSVKTILDIFNSGRSSKSINDMSLTGDTIIVSHDFGVSLMNSKDIVFYDTFFRFGSLPSNIKVNSTFHLSLYYVCTELGIAVQKPGATNLSAPESWNVYTTVNGLPSNNVNKIVSFGGSILAATDKGLSIFDGTNWSNYLSQFNSTNVKDIIVANGVLYILSNNSIYSYDNSAITFLDNSTMSLNNLSFSNSLGISAASTNGIYLPQSTSSNKFIIPNGPAANQFPGMAVDGNGNLWSASGRDVTGVGFYKFDGTTWTNYNQAANPQLTNNAFHMVYAAPDNTIYFGSWGKGFTKISDQQFTSYDTTGTGMVGISTATGFLVISGFVVDSKNDLWVLNYWPGDGQALNVLSGNTWYHFKNSFEGSLSLEFHFNLVIDQSGTKWYSVLDSKRAGLYFYNENGTLTNTNDDVSGYLTKSNGLNSNSINSLVVDQRGDLWVGTSTGVNVISNLGSVTTNGSSSLRVTSVFSLRQQTANCIAVDALNQKWVGTNEGLLLVNSDGSSLLDAYNTKNSALLSDKIVSLAIDKNNGIVYAGTDAGLTSFKTPAEKPQENFSTLFCYPSPFRISNGTNMLTIKGLVKDSDIKILTISGKLVREFSSPGGNVAFWDGKNESGNLVSSGVYLVVAFDKEGNNVTTAKIAVLRD